MPSLPGCAAPTAAHSSSPARRHTATLSASAPGDTAFPLLRCTPPETGSDPAAPPPHARKNKHDRHPTLPPHSAAKDTTALGCTLKIVSYFLCRPSFISWQVLTQTRKSWVRTIKTEMSPARDATQPSNSQVYHTSHRRVKEKPIPRIEAESRQSLFARDARLRTAAQSLLPIRMPCDKYSRPAGDDCEPPQPTQPRSSQTVPYRIA